MPENHIREDQQCYLQRKWNKILYYSFRLKYNKHGKMYMEFKIIHALIYYISLEYKIDVIFILNGIFKQL